jgi:hypothetical protein
MRDLLYIVVIASLMGACAPKAITYLNEETKFQNYKTYRLVNPKMEKTNLSKEGREIIDIVEQTIHENMRARGYQESNLDPDLILRYELITNRQTETNRNTLNPYGYYGPAFTTTTYLQSVIILDIADADKKKMIWQSSYDLRQSPRQSKKEAATEYAVAEIFYTYPYRAGQSKPDPTLADYKTGRKNLKAKQKAERKAEKARK